MTQNTINNEIRIVIVDDHPMIISGIQKMLAGQPPLRITGAFSTGRELLDGLPDAAADVLLLDMQLPDINGDELAPIILKDFPQLKILTLTNFDSPLYLHTMKRIGVTGYVLKTTSRNALVTAIKTVYRGGSFVDPALEQRMNNTEKLDKKTYARLSLTLREKEIVRLLANGHDNKEISRRLYIGYHTVRNYRARIFAKLEVNSIGELVKKALILGI